MVAFTCVRLHQNGCQFSFACKSKCLLLLVCASIEMFANSRLPLNHNGSFTCVRLHQNGCQFSFASKSKFLVLLVCACIKMFSFSRVRLHLIFFQYLYLPTSKMFPYSCVRLYLKACFCSCPLSFSLYVTIRMYPCVSPSILYFYTDYKRSLPLLP